MAARSADTVAQPLPGGHQPLGDILARSRSGRLMVISPTLAEAVQYAGGWLFDQVMAGWMAVVLTPDHSDPRPLHILGARAYDLHDSLAKEPYRRCLEAIAVHTGLYESDRRIHALVNQARSDALTEIMLWGDASPGSPAGNRGVAADPLRHRLSAAAQAFKAHALTAARVPLSVAEGSTRAGVSGDTEMFQRNTISRPRPTRVPRRSRPTPSWNQ